jgi:hypothetical protein
MKILVRAFVLLHLLSSCTTLEALSGEQPTTFRAVYAQVADAVESEDSAVGLALTTRIKDQWAGDILVDRFDEKTHLVSLGIRYFFTQEHPVQPYFGVGLAAFKQDHFPIKEALYVRVGVEWAMDGPWRVGVGWRSYRNVLGDDDSLLVVGLGWAW